MKKKAFLLFFTFILSLFIINLSDIYYGLSQLKGQLKIIIGARNIEEILQENKLPDSTLAKLGWVNEIRQFSFSELGLNPSKNYTTYYDHGSQPILWVLTACPEFSLEPYLWSFPIAGSFPYKGFFDLETARREAEGLKILNYDVDISPAGGWSTLGYLTDPVLSGMLSREEGDLANLLVHELTHSTIFYKDSVDYNENLASFIGDKGAELFLLAKHGAGSDELADYHLTRRRDSLFLEFMMEMAPILDSSYKSFDSSIAIEKKREKKREIMSGIVSNWKMLNGRDSSLLFSWDGREPNNTFFAGFLRYNSHVGQLEREFQDRFQGSVKQMIKVLKKEYEF